MTTLIWIITWLPLALPAMTKLPKPVDVTVTSKHYFHILTWQPGPGTPAGVHYNVSVKKESKQSWTTVTSCEHVQQPLVCNLTDAFNVPQEKYMIGVEARLDAQTSERAIITGLKLIDHLSLPLLSVTPCGPVLCVDLHPTNKHLRNTYEVFEYELQVKSTGGDGLQRDDFIKTRLDREEVLRNVAPGRRYCVSVRLADSIEDKISNFSQPVCAAVPGDYPAVPDGLIASVVCVLVMAGVAVLGLLVYAGFFCLRNSPLPPLLESVRHLEEEQIVAPSLTSLLNIKSVAPSGVQKKSRQTSSSDESDDEESETESGTTGRGGGGGGGGAYKLRVGTNLLSSSSSSSSSSLASEPPPGVSSEQPSHPVNPQPKAQSLTDMHGNALTTGRQEEEGERDSQDVNLLTLTFGRREEEEEEEADVECLCPSLPPVLPPHTSTETVSMQDDIEEEEEEEEEEECSGYMGRPLTAVPRTFF